MRRAGRGVSASPGRLHPRERVRHDRRPALLRRGRTAAVGSHDPAVAGRRDPDRASRGRGGPDRRHPVPEGAMVSGSLFAQGLALGLLAGGLYALLSSGLTLYFGVMRVVMVAHPAFLFLAAYTTYFLHRVTGMDPLLTIVVTVPLFFVVGIGIQRVLVSRLAPESLAMMSVLLTFALALLIEGGLGVVATGSYRSVTVEYATSAVRVFGVAFPIDKLIGFW